MNLNTIQLEAQCTQQKNRSDISCLRDTAYNEGVMEIKFENTEQIKFRSMCTLQKTRAASSTILFCVLVKSPHFSSLVESLLNAISTDIRKRISFQTLKYVAWNNSNLGTLAVEVLIWSSSLLITSRSCSSKAVPSTTPLVRLNCNFT